MYFLYFRIFRIDLVESLFYLWLVATTQSTVTVELGIGPNRTMDLHFSIKHLLKRKEKEKEKTTCPTLISIT